MQQKNVDEISNGDMGFVSDIYQNEEGGQTLAVRLEDGRIGEYGSEDYGLSLIHILMDRIGLNCSPDMMKEN